MEECINSFKGRYSFLSNFHAAAVTYNGISFATVEHAFQAAKALDRETQELVSHAATPAEAKRMGRRVKLRPDWEEVKVGVMEELLRQKFSIPELGKMLLDTGDAELIEGNNHGDRYWGTVGGVGRNVLGTLLMKVRAELRSSL